MFELAFLSFYKGEAPFYNGISRKTIFSMKCQENKMKHDFLNRYVMKTPIISH
jgi:hypothetical protein